MKKRICRHPHTIKAPALYERWSQGEPIPARQVFYMCQDCQHCSPLRNPQRGTTAKRWCDMDQKSTHYRARACRWFRPNQNTAGA